MKKDHIKLSSLEGVKVLSTDQAAKFLGLQAGTLATYRRIGKAPAYMKATNGRIAYKLDDLKAFKVGRIPIDEAKVVKPTPKHSRTFFSFEEVESRGVYLEEDGFTTPHFAPGEGHPDGIT